MKDASHFQLRDDSLEEACKMSLREHGFNKCQCLNVDNYEVHDNVKSGLDVQETAFCGDFCFNAWEVTSDKTSTINFRVFNTLTKST
jgi:hypothetical protein